MVLRSLFTLAFRWSQSILVLVYGFRAISHPLSRAILSVSHLGVRAILSVSHLGMRVIYSLAYHSCHMIGRIGHTCLWVGAQALYHGLRVGGALTWRMSDIIYQIVATLLRALSTIPTRGWSLLRSAWHYLWSGPSRWVGVRILLAFLLVSAIIAGTSFAPARWSFRSTPHSERDMSATLREYVWIKPLTMIWVSWLVVWFYSIFLVSYAFFSTIAWAALTWYLSTRAEALPLTYLSFRDQLVHKIRMSISGMGFSPRPIKAISVEDAVVATTPAPILPPIVPLTHPAPAPHPNLQGELVHELRDYLGRVSDPAPLHRVETQLGTVETQLSRIAVRTDLHHRITQSLLTTPTIRQMAVADTIQYYLQDYLQHLDNSLPSWMVQGARSDSAQSQVMGALMRRDHAASLNWRPNEVMESPMSLQQCLYKGMVSAMMHDEPILRRALEEGDVRTAVILLNQRYPTLSKEHMPAALGTVRMWDQEMVVPGSQSLRQLSESITRPYPASTHTLFPQSHGAYVLHDLYRQACLRQTRDRIIQALDLWKRRTYNQQGWAGWYYTHLHRHQGANIWQDPNPPMAGGITPAETQLVQQMYGTYLRTRTPSVPPQRYLKEVMQPTRWYQTLRGSTTTPPSRFTPGTPEASVRDMIQHNLPALTRIMTQGRPSSTLTAQFLHDAVRANPGLDALLLQRITRIQDFMARVSPEELRDTWSRMSHLPEFVWSHTNPLTAASILQDGLYYPNLKTCDPALLSEVHRHMAQILLSPPLRQLTVSLLPSGFHDVSPQDLWTRLSEGLSASMAEDIFRALYVDVQAYVHMACGLA